jgi:hypothetical protein
MNDRERFTATMHYRPRDRAPICDFSFWDETLPIWYEQGLPSHVNRSNSDVFFGMDRLHNGTGTGVAIDLAPEFEWILIEDRGDHEIVQQHDGVRVLRKKFMGSIPQHVGHLLTDRASWEQHYKPRLDPASPERYPADWDERVRAWADPNRDYPIILPGGSLYGKLRDWMGLENISLVVYDDPAWFEDMVTTVADCIIGTLTRILETGGQFEACGMWEDMCYNRGPLLSPKHFKQYLVPHYRRITDLLHTYGVDVVWVDCDGKIDALVPIWLENGVNTMFPIEVGTWHASIAPWREAYGRELRGVGGMDKRVFARDYTAVDAEVERLKPLVDLGGFIPCPDHRIAPDAKWENVQYYCDKMRETFG